MPPPQLNRDSMVEMDHMRQDLLRLFLAYQHQSGPQMVSPLQKTPFISAPERKTVFSPPLKKRPVSAVVDQEQEQPLDLSAKRPRSVGVPEDNAQGRGFSPRSLESSSESEDDEPADVEDHFRKCVNRGSILDLSRK